MCLSTFIDHLQALNPLRASHEYYPQYDILTATKWLAKELCKIPLYVELMFYFRNNTKMHEYLVFSLCILIAFGFGHLFTYLLIDNKNILFVLIIILLTIVGVFCGIPVAIFRRSNTIVNFMLLLLVVYSSFEIISCYSTYKIKQSLGFLETKFMFSLVHLLLLALLLKITEYRPSPVTFVMKIVWKVINLISVGIIISDINYHHNYDEISYTMILFDILVLVSLFLIVLDYKSVYAIALIITLLVLYYVYVLCVTLSSNSSVYIMVPKIGNPDLFITTQFKPSSVFIVTQATSQLTVVGALLYTTGYSKVIYYITLPD